MGCAVPIAMVVIKDFFDKYVLGITLGRGAFATVRACSKICEDPKRRSRQSERAVKVIELRTKEKPEEISPSLKKAAHTEALCWKAVGNHPNCVRMYDLFLGNDFCYMVMEKCKSGLLQALEGMPELTERGLGSVAAQMLLGIAHCHSVNVVHRDIKPDNFLVSDYNGQMVIKLADFGLSATMARGTKVRGVFGTAPFMSPEMLTSGWYDEKADIWSFAVIVYVLMFGQWPYLPKKPCTQAMKQAIVDAFPPPCYRPVPIYDAFGSVIQQSLFRSPDVVQLVKTLLTRDPDKRPSATETLRMPWIAAGIKGCQTTAPDLPSLRPMLNLAKKCGAFEMRNPKRETRVDLMLNKLQDDRNKSQETTVIEIDIPSCKFWANPVAPPIHIEEDYSTALKPLKASGGSRNSSTGSTTCDSSDPSLFTPCSLSAGNSSDEH